MQLELAAEPEIKLTEPRENKSKPSAKSERGRPTVRDVSLNLLEGVGSVGMKAERIRDYLDRTHGLTVHEKTVGMTLYRLSRDGLVHRVGHTWFFGPSKAETKNPGVEAPGPIDRGT